MAKQITARQAMAAYNAQQPEVKKAMKASRAAAKEREAARKEEQMIEMYGTRHKCTDCGLHFRTHDNRNVCLDCLER
jgi:hypothetical protein